MHYPSHYDHRLGRLIRATVSRLAFALLFWGLVVPAPALVMLAPSDAEATPVPPAATENDTDLFRTNVPPNILMIVDNSKSMTNTVWHEDYGVEVAGFQWKNQTSCTHFRDAFAAAGKPNGKFRIYPGGRKVDYKDEVGWKVRTRKTNNKTWEPAVIDGSGTHVWNDANANGVQDVGEWLAYYKTCNPSSNSDYVDKCGAIDDLDGDGLPGQTVRDANGNPIVHGGTGRTQIYKSDPDDTAGLGLGSGTKVKVRTTIDPREVAIASGIDPETYDFTTTNICGIDPTGWDLFEGESAAETPNGSTIQFRSQYLDFLFSSPYGDSARPAVFAPTTGNDGIRDKSPCIDLEVAEPSTYETYRRTRLMALRLVLRTVTCELDQDVRFGIAQFRFHGKSGDDNGGYVALPVNSMRDSNGDPVEYTLHGIYDSHENHMKRVISRVGPDSQTPLNEVLYQAYTYFMSRDATQLPPGRDYIGDPITGTEEFPVYDYNLDLHTPVPDDGGDLNMVGGHYVGSAVTTTHPKPVAAANLDADGLDPNGDGGLAPFPAWDGGAAPDPVQYKCQKNFVLLITDGGSSGDLFDDQDTRVNSAFLPPTDIESGTDRGYADFFTLIGDHYRNPDGTADEVEIPVGGKSSKYMDDITLFMNRFDFRPDLADDQTIDTYTVGYSVDSVGTSNVEMAAIRGNGLYFESADADQLSADIVAAFTDIIEKAQSFTSATVPASRTTDGDNFYSSYFRPKDDTPFWDGHLKNFEFTATGDILTKPTPPATQGNCAVGTDPTAVPPCPNNGELRTDADAHWDAAEQVPNPASRNLFVGDGNKDFGEQAKDWDLASVSRADLLLPVIAAAAPAYLTGAPYSVVDVTDTTELDNLKDQIVSNVAGCAFGTILGGTCVMRTNEDGTRSLLSDIFHSNPVVVGSPNAPLNEASYQAFSVAKRQRKRVIYAGANDGFLHGFLSGVWDLTLVPPRHNRGTGEEVMAYMPSDVRNGIWRLPLSQPSGGVRSYYGVDGSPVIADAWMYRDVDGSGDFTTTLLPTAGTKVEDQWRTVLMSGLRGGGRGYFALDVTDPDATNYPGYLWEFPCDDCVNAINGSTLANEGNHMGFTWSEPVITKVRVKVEGESPVTPGGHDRWVAIFGAGYHMFGDPNHTGYVAAGDPDPAINPLEGDINRRQGRAIFMVDLTTGQVLAKKQWTPAAAFDGTGQTGYPEMAYAIPSAPAVFDLDFDGYADVVYIGDLGGNIWKWVVTSVGDDPINNATQYNSEGQPNWDFKLYFKAKHSLHPLAPNYGLSHFQSFFFPPTGVLKHGNLMLALGAGERASPEGGTADGSDLNNNHYFVLKDKDPKEQSAVPLATLTEADLKTETDLDSGSYTCSQIAAGDGYFLTARDREKFITNSVIFLGEVITASFLPSPPGSDPCSDTGTSFLYRFGLECGTPAYPGNSGSGNDDRRKAIGAGLPTRPRVSVGGLNQGGGGGGCTSKVVVITSDGNIENDCPGPLPSSGINMRSWRER